MEKEDKKLKPFKTTTSIDDETYRYLYKIALFKLDDKDKEVFNKLYNIINLILKEIGSIINEDYIDFESPHLLEFIQNTDNPPLFLVFSEEEQNVLDAFENKIQMYNPTLKLKRNQIIKTLTILYYELLMKCAK
jgi:hypothetical protein